jgi:large subunit ribosomal protein L31
MTAEDPKTPQGSGSRLTMVRSRTGDPAAAIEEDTMKSGIHPQYVETTVVCGCGNTFQTRSTKESGRIVVEVCSQCHPFYTGKQKILDSGGRVARFEKRYGKRKTGTDEKAKTDK